MLLHLSTLTNSNTVIVFIIYFTIMFIVVVIHIIFTD